MMMESPVHAPLEDNPPGNGYYGTNGSFGDSQDYSGPHGNQEEHIDPENNHESYGSYGSNNGENSVEPFSSSPSPHRNNTNKASSPPLPLKGATGSPLPVLPIASATPSPPLTQKVKIGQRTLLFDLNKNFDKFEIYFEVKADTTEDEFFVRVLTQKQLDDIDANNQLQSDKYFKKTKGFISGTVKNSDKNASNNHFLALRAPKDMQVVIRTMIVQNGTGNKSHESSSSSSSSSTSTPTHEGGMVVPPLSSPPQATTVASFLSTRCVHPVARFYAKYRYLVWLAVIVLIGLLVYFYVFKKKSPFSIPSLSSMFSKKGGKKKNTPQTIGDGSEDDGGREEEGEDGEERGDGEDGEEEGGDGDDGSDTTSTTDSDTSVKNTTLKDIQQFVRRERR